MRIVLQEQELKEAMETYINKLGMSTEGKNIVVSFTAGRQGNGHTATLDIQPNTDNKVESIVPLEAVTEAPPMGEEEDTTDIEPVDETKVMFGTD